MEGPRGPLSNEAVVQACIIPRETTRLEHGPPPAHASRPERRGLWVWGRQLDGTVSEGPGRQPGIGPHTVARIAVGAELARRVKQSCSGSVLMVIGNAGAGKSTFVNYLAGCKMEMKKAKELSKSRRSGTLVIQDQGSARRYSIPELVSKVERAYRIRNI